MNEIKLIGEIGINHNGDLSLCKNIIKMAKDCGCNYVKFQKRTIDKVYTKEFLDSKRESPWGTTQREQKEGLEFDENEYRVIDRYCKSIDIEWFASAWDIESQKFLNKFKLSYNKIASPMLTNIELVEFIAKCKKTTFISTGMSNWGEVNKAVKIFKENGCPFILMHCTSIYPCQDKNLNLNIITELIRRYNSNIGYSSHSSGILDCSLAVALGAKYIEKHITLDRSMYGSDQSASIEKRGLEYIRRDIDLVNICLGSEEKVILEEELKNRNKMKYW